jgi:hypothetical protein
MEDSETVRKGNLYTRFEPQAFFSRFSRFFGKRIDDKRCGNVQRVSSECERPAAFAQKKEIKAEIACRLCHLDG